jgi:drug/metabolite transporter (DMT)-like permease
VGSLALTYHVVLAVGVAYVLWFELVRRVPAGVAALGTLMVPVVGVTSAMAWLGERPSPYDWAGFVCILAASALALPRVADHTAVQARLLRETVP